MMLDRRGGFLRSGLLPLPLRPGSLPFADSSLWFGVVPDLILGPPTFLRSLNVRDGENPLSK